MDFFLLLLISVPFFYFYGLISFIITITKVSNTKNTSVDTFEKKFIADLKKAAETNPHVSLKEFLDTYKKEQANEKEVPTPSSVVTPKFTQTIPHTHTKEHDDSDIISNWYRNNSVNLLLYIGAFLIVSSAAIFVGFQWDTISGIMKASMLTILAFAFFFSGIWFYSIPKIKNAGTTFIMIAALLIPVLGSAWYTFVLKDLSVSFGMTWLFTSLIAMAVYIFFAAQYRNAFYGYGSTLSAFSLSLSVVSTLELDKNFYILAAILANFLLLFVHLMLKKKSQEVVAVLSTPYKISTEILMPATLFYGFTLALGDNNLYSIEGVLSAFLACLFYFISHYFMQKPWQFIVAEIFIPVTILLYTKWLQIPDAVLFYLLYFCALGYAVAANWFNIKKVTSKMEINLILSLSLSLLVLLVSWENSPPLRTSLFIIVSICIALFVTYIKKKASLLFITTILIALLVYNLQSRLLSLPSEYFSVTFSFLGTIAYVLCLEYRQRINFLPVFALSTTFYFILAIIFSSTNQWYLGAVILLLAYLCYTVVTQFKIAQYLYGTVVLIFFAMYVFLNELHTPMYYYPLIFSCYAYLLYGISIKSPLEYQKILIKFSLGLSIFIPVVYKLSGSDWQYDTEQYLVERSALLSAYGTTILFGLYYMMYKTKNFAYVTSALGVLTFLWQLEFAGVTDSLMYTATVGYYFVILGYTRRLVKDYATQNSLTVIGLILLLAPPIFLSFGPDATRYSLFLGLTGILFTGLGISLSYNKYKYSGVIGIIFAVLPQTYNYLLYLPRWIVVGVIGIVFLGTAIFLLLKRGEHHTKE